MNRKTCFALLVSLPLVGGCFDVPEDPCPSDTCGVSVQLELRREGGFAPGLWTVAGTVDTRAVAFAVEITSPTEATCSETACYAPEADGGGMVTITLWDEPEHLSLAVTLDDEPVATLDVSPPYVLKTDECGVCPFALVQETI
jgi:hypothetical protein